MLPGLLLAGLFLIAGAAGPSGAAAQPDRYSVQVEDMPLGQALDRFVARSRVGVLYRSALVAGKTTTCSIEAASAEAALACLLEGTGLTYRVGEGGTYMLEPAPPPAGARPPTYTVSGYVRDAASGEALIAADVYDRVRSIGTTTNAYGFYSLTLPAGEAHLVVSYLGYQPEERTLHLDADQVLDVDLQPVSYGLDTLRVYAPSEIPVLDAVQMSAVELSVRQIQAIPTLLGETDVLRTIQLLPGVQSGNEGTTGLYVRGGGADQNLVLLDGAPVYNAAHLFGFLSVFNTEAIHDVTLIKGGFPARYGGRLSSVLDIRMKEGNTRRYAGAAAVGAAASSLVLEGPLQQGQGSFIVSGRRSFVDLVARPFTTEDEFPAYYLFDVNAKMNLRSSSRDRWYASLYGGRDQYRQVDELPAEEGGDVGFSNRFGIHWGNLVAVLRWNHLYNNKLFSNMALLYTRYRLGTRNETLEVRETDEGFVEELYRLRYDSGVRDVGLRVDFDFIPSPAHYVRFGGQALAHTFSTGTLQRVEALGDAPPREDLIAPLTDIHSAEGALYVEDEIDVSPRFRVNVGVHASAYAVDDRVYTSVEPRGAIRLRLGAAWAVKASYARMTQYLHLLTNSGLGLPTDLWVPATDRVRPQRAHQVAFGVGRAFDAGYRLNLEGYYKTMDRVIEYEEGAGFLGSGQDWQEVIAVGSGRAWGAEVYLERQVGRLTGWLGYTLSWAERTFEGLNDGRTFPYRYDRRHDAALTLAYPLTERVVLSGTWVYGTGNAVTVPYARYLPAVWPDVSLGLPIPAPSGGAQRLGPRNRFRMAPYHRLDIGVNVRLPARRVVHTLSLGAYNAYNRKNPYFLFLDDRPVLDDQGFLVDEEIVVKQASLFPIVPSFRYGVNF